MQSVWGYPCLSKYDGENLRRLRPEEVKQIAGRAGRYGIHKKGEVLAMDEEWVVSSGLKTKADPIRTLYIPFPKEALDSPFDLDVLLYAWSTLPSEKRNCPTEYVRCRASAGVF